MDEALNTYLPPATIARLRNLARESRPGCNYLKALEVCALVLQQAQAFEALPEQPGPGELDSVFEQMARNLQEAIPGGLDSLGPLLDALMGYFNDWYLWRKERIAERGKVGLLDRIVMLIRQAEQVR